MKKIPSAAGPMTGSAANAAATDTADDAAKGVIPAFQPPKRRPGRPRKLKSASALLAQLLTQPLPPGAARLGELEEWAGQQSPGGQVRVYEGMLLAQIVRALDGDLKALQFVRDTIGETAAGQPAAKAPAEPAEPAALTEADRALLHKLTVRLGLEEPA